jgi:pSer/pThr/pTyr-binding forkhead associated (FHA) protein
VRRSPGRNHLVLAGPWFAYRVGMVIYADMVDPRVTLMRHDLRNRHKKQYAGFATVSPERPPPESMKESSGEGFSQSVLPSMSKYWVEYRGDAIELRGGQLLVGRSAMCRLVLDDPLVSRQHAEFRVVDEGVMVYDLKSVNGVFVNGQRIDRCLSLHAGDRVVIGEQELAVVARLAEKDTAPHSPARRRLAETLHNKQPDSVLPQSVSCRPSAVPPDDATHQTNALDLLGGVADKVLALGRGEEAERILGAYLANLLEQTKSGGKAASRTTDRAAYFAVKLASVMSKGSWVDYAFSLFTALRRPLPGPVVDELYEVLRKVSGVNLGAVREYVALLHAEQTQFGPAERFLVQRIEGLERLASLR